ncbi:hypothetical protein QJS10_CPB13g00198 [Acorus calamus]|uniref:Protein OSB1, mitochondrial n=1 Tax=Acorus calamus TaxID=4465 RepID=A0AAV9DK47_ACOCL|nr:hypothetical protein QJS10_CPB13g00198 [Acorus calamus]
MPVTRTYYGAYTVLEVKNSLESDRTFRVLLNLEDEWAELCLEHLKPNDFVFVTGCLGSYEKMYRYGELRVLYKVNVKELNFIMPNYPGHKDECLQVEANVKQNSLSDRKPVSDGLSNKEKERDRLRLWQVFLANPREWWDNRRKEKHPKAPDFKHKDTGEVLWINPDDPPWLKRQLELLDSHMEGRDQGAARARLSTWKFND